MDKHIPLFTLSDGLAFGKHKGKLIRNIIEDDPQYVDWCLDKKIFELDAEAKSFLRDRLERGGDVQ